MTLHSWRPSRWATASTLAITLSSLGCSSAPEETPGSHAPESSATANGPRTVTGKAPAPVGGFPAIVVLEPAAGTGGTGTATAVPVMDQVQQTFIPALLLVRTGEPVEFRNNDDVLHNVKVREDATRESTFNVAIPTGDKFIYAFGRDGFYDVGCDIHPGMSAQIMSTSSPFSTLGDAQGQFTIHDVPPGSYKAVAYSGARKIERTITVPVSGAVDLSTP